LELQKMRVETEMKPLGINVDDIPGFRDREQECQKAAAALIRGRTFEEALTRFVHISQPTNIKQVRTSLEEQSKNFIADKIFGSVALDSSGKTTGYIAPGGIEDAKKTEARKKIVLHLRSITWPLAVTWKIEPARLAILEEHGIRLSSLVGLVANNPFIPHGHEGIYLRGIQAGFFGDWLVAMHLLVPQIEASIRHVIQRRGKITSTLEADGTQKERDLNQLLCMPEVEEIFGEDVTFELRGILIERFGHNMRNELAHGLMPEGSFFQPIAVYLWWLVVYLCWYGDRYDNVVAPESPS
jgi:hypothetical protein